MKKIILACCASLILALSTPLPLNACSCIFTEDGFCSFFAETELVVRAEKIKKLPLGGMEIRVLEVLRGTETRHRLKVWGSSASCEVEGDQFAIGQELVLAMNKTAFAYNQREEDDYAIPLCGVYYLRVEGNEVTGQITRSRRSMSYRDLKDLLNSPTCPGQIIDIPMLMTRDYVQLDLRTVPLGKIEVKTIDLTGRALLLGEFTIIEDHPSTYVRFSLARHAMDSYLIIRIRHEQGWVSIRKLAVLKQ